jgi:hypothetical protein
MIQVEFVRNNERILLLKIDPQTQAVTTLEGDDSWLDYKYQPFSIELNRPVGFNENPLEWIISLQASYQATDVTLNYKIISPEKETLPEPNDDVPDFSDLKSAVQSEPEENLSFNPISELDNTKLEAPQFNLPEKRPESVKKPDLDFEEIETLSVQPLPESEKTLNKRIFAGVTDFALIIFSTICLSALGYFLVGFQFHFPIPGNFSQLFQLQFWISLLIVLSLVEVFFDRKKTPGSSPGRDQAKIILQSSQRITARQSVQREWIIYTAFFVGAPIFFLPTLINQAFVVFKGKSLLDYLLGFYFAKTKTD